MYGRNIQTGEAVWCVKICRYRAVSVDDIHAEAGEDRSTYRLDRVVLSAIEKNQVGGLIEGNRIAGYIEQSVR